MARGTPTRPGRDLECLQELDASWLGPSAKDREHGGVRTLVVGHSGIAYDQGIAAAHDENATVHFIDIEMNHRTVSDYPLFELEDVSP